MTPQPDGRMVPVRVYSAPYALPIIPLVHGTGEEPGPRSCQECDGPSFSLIRRGPRMTGVSPLVFSPAKVLANGNRVERYLQGDRIYPTTIEIDLTQRCTRACPACPYSVTRRPGLTLPLGFIDRLFGILGPHTPGLVLSGGEATSVPEYPEVLAMARRRGFEEISTITNGTCLHLPRVQDALLKHGTAIRVSLYDWHEGDARSYLMTLRRIASLRERADREGSALSIGASILTQAEWVVRMPVVAMAAIEAGAHWVYFHPFCVEWESRAPRMADQTGVRDSIQGLRGRTRANIQVPAERYAGYPLVFRELHAAHFLLQIGADGVNYAGPECKYEPDCALLDLNEHMEDDFLWHPSRQARIRAISSRNYRHIGTRHRPPMFSDFIEKVQCGKTGRSGDTLPAVLHPYIL